MHGSYFWVWPWMLQANINTGGHFKSTYEPKFHFSIKHVWAKYFVWNFKGYLWNSAQNILPMHWKIHFFLNIDFLRADLRALTGLWNDPRCRHCGLINLDILPSYAHKKRMIGPKQGIVDSWHNMLSWNWVRNGSRNRLALNRWQTITWTNADLMSTALWWTNFSETYIKMHMCSFKKMYFKVSSAECQPFC